MPYFMQGCRLVYKPTTTRLWVVQASRSEGSTKDINCESHSVTVWTLVYKVILHTGQNRVHVHVYVMYWSCMTVHLLLHIYVTDSHKQVNIWNLFYFAHSGIWKLWGHQEIIIPSPNVVKWKRELRQSVTLIPHPLINQQYLDILTEP